MDPFIGIVNTNMNLDAVKDEIMIMHGDDDGHRAWLSNV